LRDAERAAAAAALRDHAERAGVVAAVLHGDEGAGMPRRYRQAARRDGPDARVELARVRHPTVHLGHRAELIAFDLSRAAGDEQPRIGPGAARAADGLAGLADRLGGNGAAVDDDHISFICQQRADALALGDVEPAAERHDFHAHAKSPQSNVPRKLSVAGPVIVIRPFSPQAISSEPPGSVTVTSRCTRPRRIAATAVAQAPVPHARVSPAPRSQTRRRIASRPSTVATLTLTRWGNSGSVSISGPSRSRSTASQLGTKNTACGLPTLTAAGCSSSSQPTGIAAVSIA